MVPKTAALEALRICRRFYPWRVVINEIRVLYRHHVPASTPVALGMEEAWALATWKDHQARLREEARHGTPSSAS